VKYGIIFWGNTADSNRFLSCKKKNNNNNNNNKIRIIIMGVGLTYSCRGLFILSHDVCG
jgi:hypothetical protein